MRKLLSMIAMLSFFILGQAFAQDRTVTGKVTNKEDGTPIPGASVLVKGTTIGTATDVEGNYKISVPADAKILVFSFIGMKNMEQEIGSRSSIDVALESGDKVLDEVVVTAIGIERSKRTLGYSFQEVKGEAISQKAEPNVLNALQGKVAGVNIVGGSGAAGASTNINIRGISSFTGSNQPLIVIDGIPVSNNVDQTNTGVFDSQPSNRLADINPDNIESINVLKGPAAAALYGSRGAAGAIMITTKTAKTSVKKTEVNFASSLSFQEVYGWPVLQNSYGQGANNILNNQSTNSWGPKFGTPGFETYVNSQNETLPYKAHPDNVRNFFRTGSILSNTVNILTGNDKSNFNLSLGNTTQNGFAPNTDLVRTMGQLVAGTQLTNGLRASGNVSFTQTATTGISQGNGGSAYGQLTRIPRSYDLPNAPYKNAAGRSVYFSPSIINPRWSAENEYLKSTVNRVIGNFTLDYNVRKWLNVKYRGGIDTYTDTRKFTSAIGAARFTTGTVIEDNFVRTELNSDLIITATKENLFLDGLNATLLLGHNVNQRTASNATIYAEQLTIPEFYNTSNAAVFTQSGQSQSLRRLVGVYSQLNLNYKNYLFADFTLRGDQSSTLPTANNTFLYPSATLGFVFTDAFKINSDILSYGKLRANYAVVGRDADPYLLNSFYVVGGYGNNLASIQFPLAGPSNYVGFVPSGRIGSNTLTPEFTTSQEVGLNLGFLKNRLQLEVTYYNTISEKQIMNVAIPATSGFTSRTTNVGRMDNEGVEVLLTGSPVRTSDFKWDVSLNFSLNRNKVIEIAEGIERFPIPGSAFIGITPSIVKGQPYGALVSTGMARNPQGQYLINPNTGTFMPGIPNTVIAPNLQQPDYLAGITNTVTYKGITLSMLFDIRQGGQIYSFGMVDLRSGGHLKITEKDRDQPRILPGVIEVTNPDGTKSYRPNNIQVSAQTYWASLGGLASEAAVFDATVYRLRELSIGYSIPKKLLAKLPFGDITFSFSARNVWFYAPGFGGDPELNKQGAGNIQGMDISGAPNTRNYGFNLRFSL
jgi:TonB-linked SusC/RagA family outer membrane protein